MKSSIMRQCAFKRRNASPPTASEPDPQTRHEHLLSRFGETGGNEVHGQGASAILVAPPTLSTKRSPSDAPDRPKFPAEVRKNDPSVPDPIVVTTARSRAGLGFRPSLLRIWTFSEPYQAPVAGPETGPVPTKSPPHTPEIKFFSDVCQGVRCSTSRYNRANGSSNDSSSV